MNRNFPIPFFISMILMAFLWMPSHQTYAADRDYNKNLLILQGETSDFIEKAKAMKSASSSSSTQDEQAMQELSATATRMAKVYFAEEVPENKAQLDKFLGKALKDNADLKSYFVVLGNAFVHQAEMIVNQFEAHKKKVRMWGIAGGIAVGMLIAGGRILIKTQMYNEALTAKDALYSAAFIGAGAAIGYGGGAVYAFKLPVDRSVTNAKEFEARYPHGENFLDNLDKAASDLRLSLSELDHSLEK